MYHTSSTSTRVNTGNSIGPFIRKAISVGIAAIGNRKVVAPIKPTGAEADLHEVGLRAGPGGLDSTSQVTGYGLNGPDDVKKNLPLMKRCPRGGCRKFSYAEARSSKARN